MILLHVWSKLFVFLPWNKDIVLYIKLKKNTIHFVLCDIYLHVCTSIKKTAQTFACVKGDEI